MILTATLPVLLLQMDRAIGGQYDAGSEASHRIIHQDGDRSSFRECGHQFATSTVADLFLQNAASKGIPARVLAGLAGPSNSEASSRGQIFEASAHMTLRKGGCFEYKYLDVPCNISRGLRGPPSAIYNAAKQAALEAAATGVVGGAGGAVAGQLQLQLPCYGRQVLFTAGVGRDLGGFCDTAKACSVPTYLRPAGSAHPIIDACIYPDTLLQYTVTPARKPINEELLEQHLQCLPDRPSYYLDYIVPADVYTNFKVSDLRRTTERVRKTLVRLVKLS